MRNKHNVDHRERLPFIFTFARWLQVVYNFLADIFNRGVAK